MQKSKQHQQSNKTTIRNTQKNQTQPTNIVSTTDKHYNDLSSKQNYEKSSTSKSASKKTNKPNPNKTNK